jgi:hypothetical protein
MGMDPLDKDETWELTFVLKGPVHKDKFKLFRAEVDTFLAACALIDDGMSIGSGGGKKLQIREHRASVRKNVP